MVDSTLDSFQSIPRQFTADRIQTLKPLTPEAGREIPLGVLSQVNEIQNYATRDASLNEIAKGKNPKLDEFFGTRLSKRFEDTGESIHIQIHNPDQGNTYQKLHIDEQTQADCLTKVWKIKDGKAQCYSLTTKGEWYRNYFDSFTRDKDGQVIWNPTDNPQLLPSDKALDTVIDSLPLEERMKLENRSLRHGYKSTGADSNFDYRFAKQVDEDRYDELKITGKGGQNTQVLQLEWKDKNRGVTITDQIMAEYWQVKKNKEGQVAGVCYVLTGNHGWIRQDGWPKVEARGSKTLSELTADGNYWMPINVEPCKSPINLI